MQTRREGFRRADRLQCQQEFRRVARSGRRMHGRGFVLLVAEAQPGKGTGHIRLGIAVGRRVGGAVVRNQLKRRIREWFRRERSQMWGNLDIVVVAEQLAAKLGGQETREALGDMVRAAGVVR